MPVDVLSRTPRLSQGTSGEFDVVAPGWDGTCERMAERIEALGWNRFTYRPA